MTQPYEIRAEICLPTTDLRADLAFFGKVLGLRLDMIYPADDPSVAVYSGHGLRVRLEQGAGVNPGLRILTDDPAFADGQTDLTSPGRNAGQRASAEPAFGAAADRSRLCRAPSGGSGALGDRAGGDAVL